MEIPRDPPAPAAVLRQRGFEPAKKWYAGPFMSVQVNVDQAGNNIVGDAANEPSIAVSPLDPDLIVVGWRQFDSVFSDFREAGYAHSDDGGNTWTFPGVLEDNVFRSDPVLSADAMGDFYYYSLFVDAHGRCETGIYLPNLRVDLFKSIDGGLTWAGPFNAFGGDKQWMTIDRTTGIGQGNIYGTWNSSFSCYRPADFSRSIDGGMSFEFPITIPQPSMMWGTLAVASDGILYLAGASPSVGHVVARSTNAQNSSDTPTFDFVMPVNLGGRSVAGGIVNPVGLLGQVWIATDHTNGQTQGNVYILGSVDPPGPDPLDVMFIRSVDGGQTWSAPVRVNDDPSDSGAWQWFGTMSVAPNGRIDVIWNDTRNDSANFISEVFYSFSLDAGASWSNNVPVSPTFNPSLGYPRQDKLGDYYHMISDRGSAALAYAATFNGEQDVYFLRIVPGDLNGDDEVDREDLHIILKALSSPADGPEDLRDLDGDGRITILDARKLVLLCTRPSCRTD